MTRRLIQWVLFIASIILMGLWFPLSTLRRDERWFFSDNFGLNTRFSLGVGDSVEEAFRDIGKEGRWLHSIRNVLHEWTKESPKRAAKFLSFLVVIEAAIIVWRG